MRVLRWIVTALGTILVYVFRTGWEAFNRLKPSVRLWTIAVTVFVAWLYFQSKLWDRNRQSFYEDVFEPTGTVVYTVFEVVFVTVLVATASVALYKLLRSRQPQNIEDIETNSAVREIVPLWKRLIDSQKKQGGDE
jgi:hypothetical protein